MKGKWAATLGILIGIFLSAMDATIIATSMPTIMARLDGIEVYFLVFSVYLITMVVSIGTFGRLSDIYGRKKLHLIAVSIFIVSSILCGLSTTKEQLILFRGLQGIGAGGMGALSFTMIGDLFPLKQRARVQAAISGIWGIATLIGPLAGGFITENWGWPWVFYVNLPFGLISALLVQISWKELNPLRNQKLDIPGALLLIGASSALLIAFTLVGRGYGWTSSWVLLSFGGTVLFLILLARVEKKSATPFVAYDLYRVRLFAACGLTGCFAVACLFGATSYMPLFIQGVLGGTPSEAGLVFLPMMGPWVLCSGASGFLLIRFGYRKLALPGMIFLGSGFTLMVRLSPESTWLEAAGSLVLVGFGLGLTVAPMLIAAQNAVPKIRMGAATSLSQFSRSMTGAITVAIMGAIIAGTLSAQRPDGPNIPSPNEVVDPIKRDSLTEEQRDAWKGPLSDGLTRAFFVGIVAAALGFISALAIPKGKAQDFVSDEGTEKVRETG